MLGDGERKTRFLGPANIHGAYADCIRGSKRRLILVMPWFTPSPQLRDDLYSMLGRNVQLCLVTRPPSEARSDLHDANLRDLLGRQRRVGRRKYLGLVADGEVDLIELLLVENVHAKTVIQDDASVVVSSSNLNVMSVGRNTEFGILSTASDVVADAARAVEALRSSDRCASLANGHIRRCACGDDWLLDADETRCGRCSEAARTAAVAVAPAPAPRSAPTPVPVPVRMPPPPPTAPLPIDAEIAAPDPPTTSPDATGRCIRCCADVPHDPDRPLCAKCYRSWSRYRNEDYDERFCHSCGAEATTTMKRPRCKPCYRSEVSSAK